MNNPTRDGYVFIGWTGTDIEEGTATTTVKIMTGSTGDRSYTATWFKADLAFDLGNGITLYMNKVTQGNSVWYAGIFEVTQAQYYAVMGTNPSNFPGNDRPVEEVSWNDIMDGNNSFMAKINAQLADKLTANGLSGYIFNLPTKAQWEYTCRAGSTGDYSKNAEDREVTENTLGEYAWYKDNSQNTTHDVGTREPNLWGFYDMHGNVYEWCAELVNGSKRAIAGAAFNVPANYCGSSQEFKQTPSYKYLDVGFRVFLLPKEN